MIKLVASDMDGTFLNDNHEVPKENKNAVEFLKENNIPFIIATGRAHYEAMPPLENANIDCDIICFNGGITYDKNGNILNMIPLQPSDIYYTIEVFKSLNIDYQLYTKNTAFIENIEDNIMAYIELIENMGGVANREKIEKDARERQNKGHLTEVDNIDVHINDLDNPTIKVLGVCNDFEKLDQARALLEANAALSVTSSGINNIEVMDKKASKGQALEQYAESKNISLENTMSLGDNLNDYSMLSITGYSVAMKNGCDEVKEVATYTSNKSNDESGVANMIFTLVESENFNDEDKLNKKLIAAALQATNFSYVPYSNFKVGSALLADNGKIFTGCNIENASYTPTNCAERTAIFKAVSEGVTKFKKIVVVGGPDGNITNYCPPCGVCRQVIAEFADEHFELILAKNENDYKVYNFFKDVLPLSFTSKDLSKK